MGCQIKGDLKYGFPRSNHDGSIHLHARRIDFIHPVRKSEITLIAPVPQQDVIWKHFERNQED
jgi:23S rRNA pseudouridine1911/1915/1917 synthase